MEAFRMNRWRRRGRRACGGGGDGGGDGGGGLGGGGLGGGLGGGGDGGGDGGGGDGGGGGGGPIPSFSAQDGVVPHAVRWPAGHPGTALAVVGGLGGVRPVQKDCRPNGAYELQVRTDCAGCKQALARL